MTGHFRGAKVVGDHFEIVEGSGCLFMNNKAYILKSSIPTIDHLVKIQVTPATVSPSVYIPTLGHLYRGDVVRYTFKERDTYFNRVYRLTENNHVMRFVEVYRDYVLDDDLTVVRGKFRTNAGEVREIDKSLGLYETYTLIGNIWENPELEM